MTPPITYLVVDEANFRWKLPSKYWDYNRRHSHHATLEAATEVAEGIRESGGTPRIIRGYIDTASLGSWFIEVPEVTRG